MKSDCFVTSLKFVQEPELGEGIVRGIFPNIHWKMF